MKLKIATITFAITIGGLFLFESYKTQPREENYAQIVQNLRNQDPTKIPTLKPTDKSGKTTIKTSAPTVTPSFAATLGTSLPSTSPTPSSAPTPVLTPTPIINTPESTPTFTPTPTAQPTQQNDQIMVISLTSPVKQNDTAQLDIKTAQESQCSIKVTLPSGGQSSAKGLEDKTSDGFGVITWLWKINWNTKPGTAIIEINCSKDSQNFSKTLQMEIIER